MKSLIIFIWISIFLCFSAFSQWTWRNPLPQGHRLESSWFFSPDTGIFTGSGGTVMKTTDGGSSWSIKQIESSYGEFSHLYNLSFTDQNHGYLLETWTNVYKTSDGGENWTLIYHEENGADITGVAFRDALNGFIIGSGGLLLITTNGGTTWDRTTLDPDEYFTGIFFTTPDSGFILSSNGSILNTSDGGETWNPQVSGVTYGLGGRYFASSQVGYVSGEYGILLKTMDGGASWNLIQPADSLFSLYSFSGIGYDTLIMIGAVDQGWNYDLRFVRSTDGGLNWSDIPYDEEDQWPGNLTCLPDGTCYAGGSRGLILKSANAGEIWTTLSSLITPNFISDIDFPSAETGYASMHNYEVVHDIKVLKTIDGGDSWFALDSVFENEVFYTVDFPTEDIGFIGGDNIYRTLDGGDTWTLQYISGWNNMIHSISFPIAPKGIAVGENGLILRTTNMGFTWTPSESGTDYTLFSVCMPDIDTGYIVGDRVFLKTVNGGESWTLTPMTYFLRDVYFVDTQTGFATGNENILKTTNGGTTWVDITPNGNEYSIRCVHFYDSDTGYVGGGTYNTHTLLLKTNDGGLHWTEEDIPTGYPIECIYVTSVNKVYAGGWPGYFFGKTNGIYTGIVPVEDVNNKYLIECYPNPFFSSTTIEFQTDRKTDVNLVIYDPSGKEIKRIVDTQKEAGKHEVSFDGSDLESGIYFYVLSINHRSFTGKLVLLK
jgi:photosystem II stability/assembly factor-like uncharacterized protein